MDWGIISTYDYSSIDLFFFLLKGHSVNLQFYYNFYTYLHNILIILQTKIVEQWGQIFTFKYLLYYKKLAHVAVHTDLRKAFQTVDGILTWPSNITLKQVLTKVPISVHKK